MLICTSTRSWAVNEDNYKYDNFQYHHSLQLQTLGIVHRACTLVFRKYDSNVQRKNQRLSDADDFDNETCKNIDKLWTNVDK